MSEVMKPLPIVFAHFSGTENGITNEDTTACSDSLASMIANNIMVFGDFPSEFVADIPPGVDPSRYFT